MRTVVRWRVTMRSMRSSLWVFAVVAATSCVRANGAFDRAETDVALQPSTGAISEPDTTTTDSTTASSASNGQGVDEGSGSSSGSTGGAATRSSTGQPVEACELSGHDIRVLEPGGGASLTDSDCFSIDAFEVDEVARGVCMLEVGRAAQGRLVGASVRGRPRVDIQRVRHVVPRWQC